MTPHRMAAVDAQFYWMSARIPSDQFLLYAFDGVPADLDRAIEQIRGRARACPELTMCVRDGNPLTYPRWLPMPAEPDQIVRHHLVDQDWRDCLSAVAALADRQLDVRRMPWRLHVFAPVLGIPGAAGRGVVAVVQVAHALGDGSRASAMAAWLFGRATPVPSVTPPSGFLPWRAFDAARGHRELARDISAGLLQPGAGSRPPLATNTRPAGARSVRTLVRRRGQLAGPTVTVAVLAAISTALFELLGDGAETLGAEVPTAKPGAALAHNHFGNVTVGLYPGLARADRMQRISAELTNGRHRFAHRATRTADRAFAALPAPLLRWGVTRSEPEARPAQVFGNTVVSSVHRGAADLSFGTAPVLLTAGYPALSPSMGLTHGVHGIGETIAVSVHAAASAVPDVDGYLKLLDAAL